MKKILQNLRENWITYGFETLVVIVGILGAFALNNWNEGRKDLEEEQEILAQIIIEYEANLQQLQQKLDMHYSIVNAGFMVLAMFKEPQSASLDSLYLHLSNLAIDPTFDPIQNDMVYSGKIRLIEDTKLRQLLSRWSSDVEAVREVQLIWQNVLYQEFLPFVNSLGIRRNMSYYYWTGSDNSRWLLGTPIEEMASITKSRASIDKNSLLGNFELEGYVTDAVLANQAAYLQANELEGTIKEIIRIAKSRLKIGRFTTFLLFEFSKLSQEKALTKKKSKCYSKISLKSAMESRVYSRS